LHGKRCTARPDTVAWQDLTPAIPLVSIYDPFRPLISRSA
jgi:hypothetical protein